MSNGLLFNLYNSLIHKIKLFKTLQVQLIYDKV